MAAQGPINFLMIIKANGEQYRFFYDDDSGDTLSDLVDDFASRSDLSFVQSDAEAIKSRIRRGSSEEIE